jgi:hypothetical protein
LSKIVVSTTGIKSSLERFSYMEAIAEYIWNGFDAKASCIEILHLDNDLGGIEEIVVRDNGVGIPNNLLKYKFIPFLESEKRFEMMNNKARSHIHGRKGIGRLTFFHFATQAQWETVFSEIDGKRKKYTIQINANTLDDYLETEAISTEEPIGTSVTFSCNKNIDIETLQNYLMKEFAWYLELNKANNYMINIDSTPLNYSRIIEDFDTQVISYSQTNVQYEVNFIQWKEKLNEEYSKYYFIDSDNNEIYKKNTSLNNKGDNFHHSVYIKSSFFNDFNFGSSKSEEQVLFGHTEHDKEFKYLMQEVHKLLKSKRRPFLKIYTDKLINDFEKNKVFPIYNLENPWERARKHELENVVRELYQVEPKIFVNLNIEQKKTFVRLLDLVMDSGERPKLFNILGDIVELDSSDREQLADLLGVSKLTSIIKTLNLIRDRYTAISQLNDLVFKKELNANERDHLQKFIEKHYWIFGEQYHLVTAAEPKFEEALRRYIYHLTEVKTDNKINHPDKLKEMDIFMVRQDKRNDIITNIVVELKRPSVTLGQKQYFQVDTYLDVIFKQDQFNAKNMFWEFYLVGNHYDSFIVRQFENAKNHGEKSLAYKSDRYKIYVKTWSEILAEFELRHNFLNERLCLERDKLVPTYSSANEIILQVEGNTAIQPGQIILPKDK